MIHAAIAIIALLTGLAAGWHLRGRPTNARDDAAHDRLDEHDRRLNDTEPHVRAILKVLGEMQAQRQAMQDQTVSQVRDQLAKHLGIRTDPDAPTDPAPVQPKAKAVRL